MSRPLKILERLVLVLAFGVALGCGGEEAETPATSAGDEAPTLSDEDKQILRGVLHPGCLDGCSSDPAICQSYCDCTLHLVEEDAELSDIALNHLEEPERATLIQQAAINRCGGIIFAHSFVRGCTDACIEREEHSEAICLSRCQCLYDELRERHPNAEGLTYISEHLSADELSVEAEAELREIAPGCYL